MSRPDQYQAEYSYSNTSRAGLPVWYRLGAISYDYDEAHALVVDAVAAQTVEMPETAWRVRIIDNGDPNRDEMPDEWRAWERAARARRADG